MHQALEVEDLVHAIWQHLPTIKYASKFLNNVLQKSLIHEANIMSQFTHRIYLDFVPKIIL